MDEARAQKILPIVLALLFTVAAINPIRNYDFFWHLATGRWIVEHQALPATDPFALASEKKPWINGEWTFQIAAYALERAVGVDGMSVVRGLLAALTFVLVFLLSKRDLLLTCIAFAGAMPVFDFRPASVAMIFVVLAIAIHEKRDRATLLHFLLSVVWINTHPSALLAPGIAAVSTRRAAPAIASALGLLVNPYGWRGIAAPLELTLFVRSGEFVNAEWQPSPVHHFPLLYLIVAGGVAAILIKRDRKEWWRALLFAGFAYLAIRHVRNQPLFFAAFPLLVPRFDLRRSLTYVASAAAIALILVTADYRLGASPDRFPLETVARLKASGLRGNIYNPDQFGGLLIWTFYPERRVLTDGRNELYHGFITDYIKARGDERLWLEMLHKYRIDLAVDEYRQPFEVIDAATGKKTTMEPSLAYWPPDQWALIGLDDAGMAFARRAAFPPEAIARLELPRR